MPSPAFAPCSSTFHSGVPCAVTGKRVSVSIANGTRLRSGAYSAGHCAAVMVLSIRWQSSQAMSTPRAAGGVPESGAMPITSRAVWQSTQAMPAA